MVTIGSKRKVSCAKAQDERIQLYHLAIQEDMEAGAAYKRLGKKRG